MRVPLIILFVCLYLSSFAQVEVGFNLGTYALTDRYELNYLEKQVNFGSQLGVNLMVPVFNEKLIFESGLFFYDHKYKIRGSKIEIPCGTGSSSTLFNSKDINVYGFNVPVHIVWNSGKICPFVGLEVGRNLLPNREVAVGMVSNLNTDKGISTHYEAKSIIIFSVFNVNVNGGIDYVFSPEIKLRLLYSIGLNDFKTHQISTLIVDGVNISGTTVQRDRVNCFQVSAIYTPDWKKMKTHKVVRPPLKERIKEIYQ